MARTPLRSFTDPSLAAPSGASTAWWLPGGHLQTIYASLMAPGLSHAPQAERVIWITPDDDEIVVDAWNPPEPTQNPLTLVLFHGLEGGSDSHYARAFALACAARGWRMVLPHFRGCGGHMNRQPRAYHSGDHAEIEWILERIRRETTGAVHALGVSLGGNALLRWAQEQGVAAMQCVDSVTSLCAPLDLVQSGLGLEQGLNRWLYTPRFLRTMKPKAHAMAERFPGRFDHQAAQRASTLSEFDDAFTAPLHGFSGVMDYWQRASAKPHLKRLAIPTLILNPLNDPFVPQTCLPMPAEVPACVTLWQPTSGGHLGWVGGHLPGECLSWPHRVLDWIARDREVSHG